MMMNKTTMLLIANKTFDDFIISDYHIVSMKNQWIYALIPAILIGIITYILYSKQVNKSDYHNDNYDTAYRVIISPIFISFFCAIIVFLMSNIVMLIISDNYDTKYQESATKISDYNTTYDIVSIDSYGKNYYICSVIDEDNEIKKITVNGKDFDIRLVKDSSKSYLNVRREKIKYPNGDIKTTIKSTDICVTNDMFTKMQEREQERNNQRRRMIIIPYHY